MRGHFALQRPLEEPLGEFLDESSLAQTWSCANLLAHAEALWTFVRVPGVEPTNNLAERDLRSFVIWRRLCYGCQSERGLHFVERVMTVAMTLRKRGRDVLDYISRCVRAELAGMQAPALTAA